MKKIYVLIIFVLIISFFSYCNIKIFGKNKNNSNINKENTSEIELSENDKKEIVNNIETIFSSNNSDTVIIEVNGEKITQKDLDFFNFSKNNSYIQKYYSNSEENEININDELIKETVILQTAQKNGIALTESEINDITEGIKKSMDNDEETTKSLLDSFQMNENEFLEYYSKVLENTQIILKWKKDILNKIDLGELNINNTEFNTQYDEYKKTTDISKKTEILSNLLTIYIDYLVDNSEIKYIQ
jgi:hypothetical protein